ncbi:hypothetical protein V9L05_02435 [Bernardetia sp. Wsw4-3y2]|uniref:hypothetical protein n=1 Tax=Bernardetia sp. Wsw4-3y2 TaxID=3127471 RepID=UPI0030D30079
MNYIVGEEFKQRARIKFKISLATSEKDSCSFLSSEFDTILSSFTINYGFFQNCKGKSIFIDLQTVGVDKLFNF